MNRRHVLVVCTGNICRSPMGEAFLRAHLAERGVTHVDVSSAGTHAQVGQPAMREARRSIARVRGQADTHVATQIDLVRARTADLILCATAEHRRYILDRWPDVEPARVALFSEALQARRPRDVADPWGRDEDVYDQAAGVIDRAMAAWAERLARAWPAADG